MVRDRLVARVRRRQLRERRPGAARRRRDRRGDPRGPRRPTTGDVPRVGAPRRQALSADLAARSSARSAAGSRKRAAGRSNLSHPELTIHVEALTDEAFYFFGKERGAGGLAGRRQRPRRVPAVGRHRLAGRGVADDAARLPRRCSCTFTATRSCRARRRRRRASWSRLLTRFQYRSRLFLVPFGEHPAAGRPHRAAAAARRHLPPADDADRRADRAARTARRRWSPARSSARWRRRRSRT